MFEMHHSSVLDIAERDELVRELRRKDEGTIVTPTHTAQELRELLNGMDDFPSSPY